MKFLTLLILIFASLGVHASGVYVVTGAKIDKISSTSGNADEFVIWTSGGGGPCASNAIKFTLAASGSSSVYDKAYSMALAAFAADFTVNVHNYSGSSCYGASYIDITK